MKWIQAYLQDGRPVELGLGSDGLLLSRIGDQTNVLGPPTQFGARLGENRKFAELNIPSVGILRSNDIDVIDAWFAHLDLSGERNRPRAPVWAWAWGILGSLVLAVVLLFWMGVPWMAGVAARNMPAEWEKSLAAGTLQSLESEGFTASAVTADAQARYRRLFDELASTAKYDNPITLEFRNWTDANAFAIPGGTVVITDQMLKLMTTDAEFQAVMAHEIGHLVERHGVRSVLQQSGAWLLVSLMVGDASGLATLTTALPAVLIDSAYSRDFEREADSYAFVRLKQAGISPKAFASIMRKMQAESEKSSDVGKYFSSHPPTDERIKAAEEAAR